MREKDCKYIFLVLFLLLSSFVSAFFLHEKVRYNKELLGLIANIFSVLTGFLLLVITTSGDVASLTDSQSIAEKYANRRKFEIRFSRYMLLFYLYLAVLCLIFFYYMIMPSGDSAKVASVNPSQLSLVLEFFICWLSLLSFVCSFFIPIKLKKIYNEKIHRS